MMDDNARYTIGTIIEAQEKLIDKKASKDPQDARVARLNQELINAFDNFLDDEMVLNNLPQCLSASVHGMITVLGTIAVNIRPEGRKELVDLVRKIANEKINWFEEEVLPNIKE